MGACRPSHYDTSQRAFSIVKILLQRGPVRRDEF